MLRTAGLNPQAYRWYWWRRLGRALGWTLLSGGWLWWCALQRVVEVGKRAPSFVDADYWLLPGFELDHDQVQRFYAERLWRCLRLWKPGQSWCLSGCAIDADSRSEALAGLVFLRDHGLVPVANLVLDERARDSAENLQGLPTDWPADAVIAVLSNRWHLARCAWLANALGIRIKLCAAERRWRPQLGAWLMAAREALALLSWVGPEIRRISAEQLLRPRYAAIVPAHAQPRTAQTRKLPSP